MKNIKNNLVSPVLQWAGGKRQLLDTLVSLLPQNIDVYSEPFVGGGALFFYLQPNVAYINDINNDLILTYKVIKDDVESLITNLQNYKNDAEFFYNIRNLDRDKEKYSSLSDVQKAARIIYLNKTCYNGLFRVNKRGEFNSSFGRNYNANFVNDDLLHAVSLYLNSIDIHLTSLDYTEVLKILPENTFVYLDPPYDPVSNTSNFTRYSKEGFNHDDQIRLREHCDNLNARGIKFMLSNSATDFIKEQYANYNITIVKAKRTINSNSAKRGEVDEVIIRNYN